MTITNNPINQQLFSNFEAAVEKSRKKVVYTAPSTPANTVAEQPQMPVMNDIPQDKVVLEKKIEEIVDKKVEEKLAKKEKNGFSPLVLLGSLAGTAASVFLIKHISPAKPVAGNMFKKIGSIFENTGLKEMLLMGAGSILGGLGAGVIFDKKENRKEKVKESIYQFNNIALPACLVAGLQALALSQKSLTKLDKEKNAVLNWKGKLGTVAAAVGAGIPLAAVISNTINNHLIDKDNPNKRKIRLKDCLVHIDDIMGATVLSSQNGLIKTAVASMLPLIYTSCGYEAGNKD
jgi:hypothetical protein